MFEYQKTPEMQRINEEIAAARREFDLAHDMPRYRETYERTHHLTNGKAMLNSLLSAGLDVELSTTHRISRVKWYNR